MITQVVDGFATTETPADMLQVVTRADVAKGEIRLFAGRKVHARMALPEGAKEETVAGILAAAQYPTSQAELADHIEDSLEEATRRTGSVIPDAYRYTYGEDQNNGDDVALSLKTHCGGGLKERADMAKLEEVVEANGIRDRYDVWLEKGLNNGMLRMNTGNVLRGKVRKGDTVRIGDRVWNNPSLDSLRD
jgi:hypothetical protein